MTDLILVPTADEQQTLAPILEAQGATAGWAFQLCGFGPIAAAARTASLVARYRPQRVLLIGVAGSFDVNNYPLGSACRFDQVACYGVGIGSGEQYRGAGSVGWQQFSGGDARPKIGDVIPLMSTFVRNVPCHGQLLTSCAASASQQDVQRRKQHFPEAVAEDMEGFGVALACTLAGVPLQIVRGISNEVGDRDRQSWRIEEALHSAAELAMRVIPWRWIPSES